MQYNLNCKKVYVIFVENLKEIKYQTVENSSLKEFSNKMT